MGNKNKGRISIVGFGYIGCTIGAVLASRGYDVVGIEKSQKIIDSIENGESPFPEPGLGDLIREAVSEGNLSVSDEPQKVAGTDVVVIAVGTPLSEDGEADLAQIKSACNAIAPYLSADQLIVFKSTLPPGVTSAVATPLLRQSADVMIAFSPERIAEGRAVEELISIPIVVGGVDKRSSDRACEFWRKAVGVEVITVGSSEAAELVKLADNLWIDLNICLANELAKLADTLEYDIDILEVIRAANTLPKGQNNVNILTPSMGVGGYCLTKDPWFVDGVARRHGLELLAPRTSRTVNDGMPEYTAQRIAGYFKDQGKSLSEVKIAVLGLAFKTNTGDCRFTPVKPVLDKLREYGVSEIRVHDPWVSNEDARALGVDLIDDPLMALDGADCAAFFTGHDQFNAITPQVLNQSLNSGGLVFDGRIFFSQDVIKEIKNHQLAYRGIGR